MLSPTKIVFSFFILIVSVNSNEVTEMPNLCHESDAITKDGVNIYPRLTNLEQDNPDLIKALKEYILISPDGLPLNLSRSTSMKNLDGQYNQPSKVEEILQKRWSKKKWKKKIGTGFFIEAGACDGEHISNSLYFELKKKWTGLLVEPNPDFIGTLKLKHRNSWILPHCLSVSTKVELVNFDASMFNGGIMVEGRIKPADFGAVNPDRYLPHRRTIQMQCFPLFSVLKALGNPTVDYFSLDIEGAEMPILKTLPWKQVQFELIGIETNHIGEIFDGSRDEMIQLLQENGYIWIDKAGHDDFFVPKKNK